MVQMRRALRQACEYEVMHDFLRQCVFTMLCKKSCLAYANERQLHRRFVGPISGKNAQIVAADDVATAAVRQ